MDGRLSFVVCCLSSEMKLIFSSRACFRMSLKIFDWTALMYIRVDFLGRFFIILSGSFDSWPFISLRASSNFFLRRSFPIFMLLLLMPNLWGPK